MTERATLPPLLLVKRLTRTVGETLPGHESHVLGLATDADHVYATQYHNPVGAPKSPLEPGHLFLLRKDDLSEVARVPVGLSPRWVAVDPGRRRAYVVNYGAAGRPDGYTLSVVDTAARKEIARLDLGQVGVGLAVDTKRNRVYVPNPFAEKLHVFDGATLTELAPVPLGKGPQSVTVDEVTGLVYVSRVYHSGTPHRDDVVVLDGSGDAYPVVATLADLPERSGPKDVRVHRQGASDLVFVGRWIGSPAHPYIAVYRRTGTTFTRQPDLPATAGVQSLDLAPKSTTLYAQVGAHVQTFDVVTGAATGQLRMGKNPQVIRVDALTGQVFVGHGTDGTLSRLAPLPSRNRSSLEEHLGLIDEPVQVGPRAWFLGQGFPRAQRPPYRFDQNASAADTTNTDDIRPGGSLGLDLDGSGVTVGVFEAKDADGWKARTTHREFGGRLTIDPADLGEEPDSGLSSHATHVAGTIGARGVDRFARGMAPGARLVSFGAENEFDEMAAAATDPTDPLLVSNHSYSRNAGWGFAEEVDTKNAGAATETDIWDGDYAASTTDAADHGRYDDDSRRLDEILHDAPNLLSVWAAGNSRGERFRNRKHDGTYVTRFGVDPASPALGWLWEGWYRVHRDDFPLPASDGDGGTGYDILAPTQTAKNSLVVGAIFDVTADPASNDAYLTTGFSSYGPTDDGRVKPDLVANGDELWSSDSSGDDDYALKSGTSMSAPNVTGTAALLIQHHRDLYGGATPTAARLKGLMIHTATDVAGFFGTRGPDYRNGWGVLNAAAAATFLTRAAAADAAYRLEDRVHPKAGPVETIPFTAGGVGRVKATVVWHDPPGTPSADGIDVRTPVLRHDLDLSVVAPDGTVHHPWTLDPANPSAAAAQDKPNHVDNVEQVLIDLPVAGKYQVRVGHTGSLGADQPYTLLVSQELLSNWFEGGGDWGLDQQITSIAFGDVDGDGRMEVGITRTGTTGPKFFVYDDAENGHRLLFSGGESWSVGATCIAFGDVDGDGVDEIGVTRNADQNSSWFVYDDALAGFGRLHEGGAEWGEGRYATAIAFGHVDRDGAAEVGVVRRTENGHGDSWFVYDDASTGFAMLHASGAEWGDDRYAHSIAFGDVDGDGLDEVGVTRKSSTGDTWFVFDDIEASFELMRSGGAEWGADRGATSLVFGHVDDDGAAEIGIVRSSDSGASYLVLDDANAGFAQLLAGGEDWGDGRWATALAFGDLDNDGRDELAVGRRSDTGPRYWVLDDATTGFAFLSDGGADWGEDRHVATLAIGNVDGDARGELAIGRRSDNGPRFWILG